MTCNRLKSIAFPLQEKGVEGVAGGLPVLSVRILNDNMRLHINV